MKFSQRCYKKQAGLHATSLQKLRKLYILRLEGGFVCLVSHKLALKTACAGLWLIYSSNKSVQANRKAGDSKQSVCRKKRRLEEFLYL
jgi:hypothetical protein